MKQYFILIAIILGMIAPTTYAQEAKKKVAVYMTGNDVNESYKKVIGAKLVSAITMTDEYAAVERTSDFLAALSAEQDYQTSGEVQDSQIARLGQKFGVLYVAVADVSELFNEIFISARLINVESGLVETAFDTNSPVESMEQLTTLSTKVAKGLITERPLTIDRCSTQPKHLALCVKHNNTLYYLSQKEWNRISDKSSLQKEGLCLLGTPAPYVNGVVIGLRPLIHRSGCNGNATIDLLTYVYNHITPIKNALEYFGGALLTDRPYSFNRSFTAPMDLDWSTDPPVPLMTGNLYIINTGEFLNIIKKDYRDIISYDISILYSW